MTPVQHAKRKDIPQYQGDFGIGYITLGFFEIFGRKHENLGEYPICRINIQKLNKSFESGLLISNTTFLLSRRYRLPRMRNVAGSAISHVPLARDASRAINSTSTSSVNPLPDPCGFLDGCFGAELIKPKCQLSLDCHSLKLYFLFFYYYYVSHKRAASRMFHTCQL